MNEININNEVWRTQTLRKKLNLNLDEFVISEFKAVAIHSNSSMIDANSACAELFGYSCDEIRTMNAWLFFAEESAPVIMEKLITKSELPYQVIGRRKDGSTFNVEIKGSELEIQGEPIRLVLLREV